MPIRNFYTILVIFFISIFICSKTSLKTQIVLQVADQLKKHCLETPNSEQLFQGALSGMVEAVGDNRYTEYIPPKEQANYMLELQGQYAGVGLSNFIKDSKSGEFYFVPLRESPATEAGLKFGDRIVEIDNQSVLEMSIIDLSNHLRGRENTTVKLKIRRRSTIPEYELADKRTLDLPPSGQLNVTTVNISESTTLTEANANESAQSDNIFEDITLTRAIVQQDVVTGDRLNVNGLWIFTIKDYPQIGYIRINEFTDSTGIQTHKALEELEANGVSKIIVDFRGNPGGFLRDAVEICNEFLSSGSPIVETRNKNKTLERYVANLYPRKRFQVAILIDGESASASEIVSAALQDAGVAKIIGVRSYGKGTIQGIFELPCNTGILRMTTASFWRPSGSPIHRNKDANPDDQWGVSPDPGFETSVSVVQSFYSNWVRSIRVLEPESKALDAKALRFMTHQTNIILQSHLKGQGFAQLEAAEELGISLVPNDKNESNKIDPNIDHKDSSNFISFRPSGRAPYFDPQLDRAIDYLDSIEPLQTTKQKNASLDVHAQTSNDIL